MISRTGVMAALALVALASVAVAQDKAPDKGAKMAPKQVAPVAPANPPAQMPTGKPAAENDMFKKWVGTWTCQGTDKDPEGKEMKYKASWTVKSTLGGNWYAVVYKRAAAKPVPAFEGDGVIGWDAANKRYIFAGVDSMGGWINLTATDGMMFGGDSGMMGAKTPAKISFAKGKDKAGKDSDKAIDVTMSFGPGGSTESCKK